MAAESSSNPGWVKKAKNKHLRWTEKSSSPTEEERKQNVNNKSRDSMLCKPGGKWFEEFESDPEDSCTLSKDEVAALQTRACKLLQEDVKLYKMYQNSRKKKSDFHWINTVLKSGTLSDQMAGIMVLIQDSAVHNLASVDHLLSMVNIKAKRECVMAMGTLRDLFIDDLLPKDRKLKTFVEHPLHKLNELSSGNKDTLDKRLLIWHFEDCLKKSYIQFIMALNLVSRDTVLATKTKAVTVMYELLVCHPEREEILVTNLVNKLGDPTHKMAARGSEKLNQYVERNPVKKTFVIQEVERLLFRPNVGQRAQYYSVCFLNQLILSNGEEDLAGRLITIYFAFFKASVKRNEVDTKMMSALLTGVNRAYPYSQKKDNKIMEHINTMYKVVHTVSFNISVQALMLIHQVLDSEQSVSDRYYVALYRKLMDPDLQHCTRQAMFLNLVFQSLKNDTIRLRIQAFIKRLLQVCFSQAPPVICSILLLISEISRVHTGILLLEQKSVGFVDDCESDDEERFVDVDEDKTEPTAQQTNNSETKKESSSWFHKKLPGGIKHSNLGTYDPQHRNPTYCGVGNSCFCELLSLSRHFHPSVVLFAQRLLQNKFISYTGDPLQDFTLIHFLDRFVYRNPKKPLGGTSAESRFSVFGKRKLYVPAGAKLIPVASKQFITREERLVPVEERFLYQYFTQKNEMKTNLDKDDDDESVASGEFLNYLSKYERSYLEKDVDLDFGDEITKHKNKTKKKNDVSDDSESEAELSEDFEDDLENDEEFQDAFKDFDEDLANAEKAGFDEDDLEFDEEDLDVDDDDEVLEFSDSDTEKPAKPLKGSKRKNTIDEVGRGYRKKLKLFDSANPNLKDIFKSADEFGSLMDENANTKFDTTTTNALANKDRAHVKQLNWELQRDQYVRGADWKSRRKHSGIKKKKMPTKLPGGKNKPTKLPSGKNKPTKLPGGKNKPTKLPSGKNKPTKFSHGKKGGLNVNKRKRKR